MATRIELPKFQAFDANGDPLSGGLVYTYIVGTDTLKATSTDRDAGTPNANPVVLDSRGEADIYGTGSYKIVLKDSADNLIWTLDNIRGINEISSTSIGDYSGDFDAAITAIGATETTLYINEVATMSANVTVPATCTVILQKGGSIDEAGNNLTFNGPLICQGGTITNDGTTTINSVFEATDYLGVFSTTGEVAGTPQGNGYSNGIIDVQWFNALGDGSTDDTTAIQNALDMANSLDASAAPNVVIFPFGTYKITSTLTWYTGTCIEGVHNSIGSGSRWPEIAWFGAAGGNIIETDDGEGNRHIKHIRRIVLRHGDGASNRADYGVYLKDRADLGTTFEDFQVVGVDENGIYFLEGGINVHLRNVRFDGCLNHAINWIVSGHDSMSIDGFTVDNVRAGEATSGGAVHFDLSSASNNWYINFAASNGKIEANDDLASGDGFFKFTVNPALSQKEQVRATFSDVWVAAGGGITEVDGIVVTPAYDFVKVVLINCWRMAITGIPSFNNALASSKDHVFTTIAPHSLSINSSPAAEQSMNRFDADSDFHQMYQFGEKAVSTLYKAPDHADWDSNPHTVYAGQWFVDPAELSLSVRHVDEVTATGTLGTLTAITGTGTITESTLTLNDVSDLKLGHVISIGADTGKRIFHINATTKVVTLHSALAASHAAAAVSFTAPTTQSHQLLTVAAAAPAAGTYVRGDVVFNSGASAGGTVGWVCTTAGTPGTWKAFGDIAA